MSRGLCHPLMSVGRRVFAGTPIQRLNITTVTYTNISHSMDPEGDAATECKGVKLNWPTQNTVIVPDVLGGYFESYDPNASRERRFGSDDFAELLFANYRHRLKRDEVSRKVVSLSGEALLALPVYANENLNLDESGKCDGRASACALRITS